MSEFDQLVAPNYPVFLGSELKHPTAEKAFFHVLPVPYEDSVSYGGGTHLGPSAILQASWQLESWDGKSRPLQLGIHTLKPIDTQGAPAAVLGRVAKAVTKSLKQGAMPIALGGEHTVTWGVIKGYLDAGITDFGVVQIDAHADLRHSYEDNLFSHASVMKRVVEAGIPVLQLGVRALCEEEMAAREQYKVTYFDAEELVPLNIGHVKFPANFPKKVFFTLDVDGVDPSIFPSTGTPVPGGLNWYQTLSLFESVVTQKQLIGFDIMEFAPIEGFHAYSFSAALLTYKMMGIVQRHRPVE